MKTRIHEGQTSTSYFSSNIMEQMPIQHINSPGCYVDSRTGHLFRVTPEMLSVGGTVFHGFVSSEPWFVTKISGDYAMPLDEARIVAANASLHVHF